MDPITLGLLGIGGYFGYKKVLPWVKDKVATLQHEVHARTAPQGAPAPQALPMQLDPGLNPAQLAEISNLLTIVTNASLVRTASDVYRGQNFTLAASALDSRARQLGG